MAIQVFDADHPRVLDGTYDVWGFNRKERAAKARKAKQQAKRCDHKFIDSKHCLKCGWTPDV